MIRALSLARDPFAPICDADLFWEDRTRAELRRTAAQLLRAGRGVWVSGAPGSGRATLLNRVADELAAEGRPVLRVVGPVAASPEGFLAALLAGAGGRDPGGGLLAVAEALYGRLLRAFSAAGPVVCFPGALSAQPAVVAEVEILSGLRVGGGGVVGIALTGGGESPLPGLATLRLPPLGADGVRAVLLHRLTVCGGSGLLSPEVLDRLAARAAGLDEILLRAQGELWRLVFERSLSAAQEEAPAAAAGAPGSLFEAAQLEELSDLLASLGPSGQ